MVRASWLHHSRNNFRDVGPPRPPEVRPWLIRRERLTLDGGKARRIGLGLGHGVGWGLGKKRNDRVAPHTPQLSLPIMMENGARMTPKNRFLENQEISMDNSAC